MGYPFIYSTNFAGSWVRMASIRYSVAKCYEISQILSSYQVRFAVLQAGAYGLPQGRHRIVYIAATTGIPLPDFPLPTHQFSVSVPTVNLPTLNVAPAVTRDCVPHRQIVTKDALMDLPGFHWSV
jgi:DNA (cytosine-5)-methyltransferase 1